MSLPRPASRLLPGLLACALLAACRATAPAAPAVVDASPVVDAPALAAREAVIEGRVTGAFIDEPTAPAIREAVQALDPRDYDAERIREHARAFGIERFEDQLREQLRRRGLLCG